MKKKILIIGSNFALKTHLKIVQSIFKNAKIFITSPNIEKKKINNKNFIISNNLEELMKNNKFYLIISATIPKIQEKFIKYLIKNKKKTKFILLEKPVSRKPKYLESLIKYSLKENIKISVNYTYRNLKIIKEIEKINLDKLKVKKLIYQLSFLHYYFIKRNSSWKNFISQGGGIINYYLNHIIFSLTIIFRNLKFTNVNLKINKKKELSNLNINFVSNNIKIIFKINLIEKNKFKNNFQLYSKKKQISFGSVYKNWYKRYFFEVKKLNGNTTKKFFNEDIISLIKKNYYHLLNQNNKEYLNFLDRILLCEKICYQINNKIKKYDFKKV